MEPKLLQIVPVRKDELCGNRGKTFPKEFGI
jgi:hypothetical protein